MRGPLPLESSFSTRALGHRRFLTLLPWQTHLSAFRHEAPAERELRARRVNGVTGRARKLSLAWRNVHCKRSAKDAALVSEKYEDVKHARISSGVGAWGRSPLKSADPGGARGVWVSLKVRMVLRGLS